jgi:hypothetical protein
MMVTMKVRMTRLQTIIASLILFSASPVLAAGSDAPPLFPDRATRVWQVDWTADGSVAAPLHNAVTSAFVADDQTAPPPRAVEYSHAYQVRAKIHRYASFATLPLFATELALGQSLYDSPGGGKKTAHAIVGAGIASLFAVNTVTGVWNLVEARKDPVGRKKRFAHGLLMMAADAGFFATVLTAPDAEHGDFTDARSTHRTIAITSIGLATTGYLIMLFGGK